MKKRIGSGEVLVILAGSLWGTTGVWSHLFREYQLSSMMMALFRVTAATIILTILVARKGKETFRMTKRGYLIAALQGILTQAVFNITYFESIESLGMSSAVVLLYTSPIYVTIMARFMFREKITYRKMIAIVITMIGCALTATGGVFDLAKLSIYGIAMGLIAGFCYATLAITGRYLGEEDDPLAITYYTFVFGLLGLIVLARPWTVTGLFIDGKLMMITFGSGLLSAVIPYLAFSIGITKLREASMAPILSSVENIVATAMGFFLFAEPVGMFRVVGIVLVILAIYMT